MHHMQMSETTKGSESCRRHCKDGRASHLMSRGGCINVAALPASHTCCRAPKHEPGRIGHVTTIDDSKASKITYGSGHKYPRMFANLIVTSPVQRERPVCTNYYHDVLEPSSEAQILRLTARVHIASSSMTTAALTNAAKKQTHAAGTHWDRPG